MGITFSGMAAGFDTQAVVDQLVAAARTPITRLQTQRAGLESKNKKLTSIGSKLGDLAAAAKALGTPEKASPTKASSSDETVVRATGAGVGATGRYDVKVISLAKADRHYGAALAARDAAGLVGAGTLSIAVGAGTAVDVAVEASDTLDSIASKINAAGAGVTASVLSTVDGFRLQIAGIQTGAANALTLTESGTTLGLGGPGGHPVVAADALVEVDGFSVTGPTNTLSGAIPGVTLELEGTSPVGTTQAIEVARDSAAVGERLKSFVAAWNTVTAAVNAESTVVSGVKKGADSLSGDSSLRTIQSRLRTIATSAVAGATGRYTTLASIGVSVQRDGTLLLDESKLTSAMGADADAVARVLGADGAGVMGRLEDEIEQWRAPATGLLDARATATRSQQRRIDDQVERLERRLDAYESQLRAQFTSLERLMSGMQGQSAQLQAAMGRLEG